MAARGGARRGRRAGPSRHPPVGAQGLGRAGRRPRADRGAGRRAPSRSRARPPRSRLFLGFPLVVAQAAAITAAALAGHRHPPPAGRCQLRLASAGRRARGGARGARPGRLRAVVGLVRERPVRSTADRATDIPTYMTDAAAADPDHGILVVRGTRALGFSYVLTRTPGVRLGDDSVMPSTTDQAPLTRIVEDLATAPEPADVAALSRLGVAYVYAPRPGRHRAGRQPGQRQRGHDRQRVASRRPGLAARGRSHRRRPALRRRPAASLAARPAGTGDRRRRRARRADPEGAPMNAADNGARRRAAASRSLGRGCPRSPPWCSCCWPPRPCCSPVRSALRLPTPDAGTVSGEVVDHTTFACPDEPAGRRVQDVGRPGPGPAAVRRQAPVRR